MLCRTLFLRASLRPELRLSRLGAMLKDIAVPNAPWVATPVHTLSSSLQALFAPLFTPNSFVFENHQLTMLGDTLMDEYLSRVFMDYFLDMGIAVTTNTVKLVNAVFHNHFSMRRLAEDIGMVNLSSPPGPSVSSKGVVDLSFLEAAESGPSSTDVAGTSFDVAPLSCGQSVLGWKFSHFLGALQRCYGDEAVRLLLDALLGLNATSNLVGKSTEWLYELVKRYSAMHVTEALLAAQGLPAEFVGSSDFIEPAESTASGAAAGPQKDSSAHSGETVHHADEGTAVAHPAHSITTSVRGFEASSANDVSIGSHVTGDSAQALTTPLAGPEFINALEIWREQQVQRGEVLNGLDGAAVSSGWLTPEEHAKEKRGAAYHGFVDFTSASFFADTAGVPHPVSGKRVVRRFFQSAVRDKQFFDKLSDFRDGLPMDTNGRSVPEFLKALNNTHHRVFDVALVVDGSRVLGRATSSTYSGARVAVSQAYLMRTLRDLSLLQNTARQGETADVSS